MASDIYKNGINYCLDGTVDLDTDDIRVVCVTSGYTPNFTTDDALDDIVGGNRVHTSGALTGVSLTLGILDADDETLTSVTGSAIVALVLFAYNATESLAKLIAYIDPADITPDGGNILITWDNGANKIINFDS